MSRDTDLAALAKAKAAIRALTRRVTELEVKQDERRRMARIELALLMPVRPVDGGVSAKRDQFGRFAWGGVVTTPTGMRRAYGVGGAQVAAASAAPTPQKNALIKALLRDKPAKKGLV